MAIGKNKRNFKSARKGAKKRTTDPLSKKDWYEVMAPNMFSVRKIGKTLISKTAGRKIASEGLKGRVFKFNLADLQNNEDEAHRNIKLIVDDVQGRDVLTNFYGMEFTTDKLRSLVRKWQTLIEARVDVRTQDGYVVRIFCIAFTKRNENQVKKMTYAQTAQVRRIRKRMFNIMKQEASAVTLKDLVQKLIPEVISKRIEKSCSTIFPLYNVFIRKVKMVKRPKVDLNQLMDLHTDAGIDIGQAAA